MGVAKEALEALARWDLASYGACLDENAVERRPQMAERFVGRERIIGMYRAVPMTPDVEWTRIVEAGDSCIGIGLIRYSPGEVADHLIAVLDTNGRSVVAASFYFAMPLDPIPYHREWSEPDV